MEPEFKPGDVVVLKSGGPAMTVESVVIDSVGVVYFFKDSCQRFQFDRVCLMPTLKGK